MSSLWATGQNLLSRIPPQSLPILLVTFIIICITTRFLSRDNVDPGEHTSTKGAKSAPTVPYWIPYLGHIPQMVINADAFLSGLRKLFPRGAFSLNFLGGTHTVIFKPGLVSPLINLPAHIADGHESSKHLMKSNFGYPRSKADMETYDKMQEDLLLQYRKLTSEPSLSQMVDRTVQRLRHNIAEFVTFNDSQVDQTVWERTADAVTTENAKGEVVVAADLYDLVRNFIGLTANVSLFGTDFVENFPDFWENLWMFDEGFVVLAMDLPALLPIGKAIRARRARYEAMRCLREFEIALDKVRDGEDPGPEWSDLDNVSPLIQGRVDEVYRKHNMTIKQRSACEFGLAWAMNANSNPFVFWLLWRIYSDAVLLSRIREEIEPYIVLEKPALGFGAAFNCALRIDTIDTDGLLNKCPLLKAAYIETLRVDVGSWSLKAIREDIIISDKENSAEKLLLRGGTYAHGAHELHHMNPDAFEDPTDWRIDRHIKWTAANEKGEKEPVVDMGSIRPYGGGVSMCKGRQFAAKEILVFTASIIMMYDMQPAGGGPWKLPEQAKAAGTKRPTSSTRVWIKSRELPKKES
ncbi:25-hydroxycholesterol 7-alpha-hydroxylase [Cytospora mali]|uniref:25-hydroxycholesterol 7-alpha-hydroxylase n=1 Tax=Cytospora mali TaxID=578113 RepID=A0A194VKW7_CYTMA|nr:25-hydroxycholesterol 7-alpha-hydroxylase [Valsa mali]